MASRNILSMCLVSVELNAVSPVDSLLNCGRLVGMF
jgi:hypothetical protein